MLQPMWACQVSKLFSFLQSLAPKKTSVEISNNHLFTFFVNCLSFFFFCFSSVSCYVRQFLVGLHLFLSRFFFRFSGEHFTILEKKIQIIIFNKDTVMKISRIPNTENPPKNLIGICVEFLLMHVS